jgi:MFS family permease
VERELALSHRGYAVVVLAAPLVIAALLEGAIVYVSDSLDRRRLLGAGQAVLAVALIAAAWTTSALGLTIDLAIAGAASGVACSAAQAIVVAAERGGADRAMVRWTLYASVGDVIAPLVTASAIALGYSYRAAMLAVGVVVGLQCVATIRGVPDDGGHKVWGSSPPTDPLATAATRALRTPRLWAWLFAAATCTLLDEIVVALGALRMDREQGAAEAVAVAAALAFSLGAVIGSAASDRAVGRWGSRAVLTTSAVACLAALVALVFAHGVLGSAAAMFALGVACAPHHGLALAQAYDLAPTRPGMVQAIAQVFVVVDVGAPLAIGAVADRLGTSTALAALGVQPVVILLCAVCVGVARSAQGGGLSDER